MTLHAIVPADGASIRLWPFSRRSAPKFLADPTGSGKSMLQATMDRPAPTTDDVTIITGVAHADIVAALAPGASLVVEPSARGTMGVVDLATAVIEARGPEAVIGSFAASHLIVDEEAFRRAVSRAAEAAGQGYVITIGISPDHPSTAYGYIEAGGSLDPACSVARFVEKSDEATVVEYLTTGRYLWNTGMFVAKVGVLMDALARLHSEPAEPLRALAVTWEVGREDGVAEYWGPLGSVVTDTVATEPFAEEGGAAVVPVKMGWSDVGDYALLVNVVESDEQVVPRGSEQTVLVLSDALVYTGHKFVVVVGISETIAVDMDDVLSVTTRTSSQDVKLTMEALGWSGLGRLA